MSTMTPLTTDSIKPAAPRRRVVVGWRMHLQEEKHPARWVVLGFHTDLHYGR